VLSNRSSLCPVSAASSAFRASSNMSLSVRWDEGGLETGRRKGEKRSDKAKQEKKDPPRLNPSEHRISWYCRTGATVYSCSRNRSPPSRIRSPAVLQIKPRPRTAAPHPPFAPVPRLSLKMESWATSAGTPTTGAEKVQHPPLWKSQVPPI
jgi:hypothetical protein